MTSPKHTLSSADVSSTSEKSGHKSNIDPATEKSLHMKEDEVNSPPSIPVVTSLSSSWSKDDATHAEIEALLKPEVESSSTHVPNTQDNKNISSRHVSEQLQSKDRQTLSPHHRVKYPSILATPNNRKSANMYRGMHTPGDQVKSVNFAPSTNVNHSGVNSAGRKPLHTQPQHQQQTQYHQQQHNMHYYGQAPPQGYYNFSSPSTNMNYNNQGHMLYSHYHPSGPPSSSSSYYGVYPQSNTVFNGRPFSSVASTPGRNSAGNPSEHDIRAAMEASSNVLRSPPPKKQRMKDIPVSSESCSMPQATVTMDSWDDEDDHVGVMSPSVFRSPKVDYKDGETSLIDFKRSPGSSSDKDGFDPTSFGSKDEDDDEIFQHSSSFDIDPNEKTPSIRFDKNDDDDKVPERSPLLFDFNLSPMQMTKRVDGAVEVPSPLENKFPSPVPLSECFSRPGPMPSSYGVHQTSGRPLFEEFAHFPPDYHYERIYHQHHEPSPGFRMKIGDVGTLKNAETRRGVSNVNASISRGTPSNRYHSQSVLQTPMKSGPNATSTPSTITRVVSTSIHPASASRRSPYPVSTPLADSSAQRKPQPLVTATPSRTISSEITIQSKITKKSENEEERKTCHCKRSQCLKLYCDCFAAKLFCDGCKCIGCKNTEANRDIRDKAVQDTISKNSMAFKPRVPVNSQDPDGNNKGCNCKNSGCLKKYCVCYSGGFTCGEKCKCLKCSNFPDSKQLFERRIKDAESANNLIRRAPHIVKDTPSSKNEGQRLVPPTRPMYPSHHIYQPGAMPPPKMMSPEQYMDSHSMMTKGQQPHYGYSPAQPYTSQGTPAQTYSQYSHVPLPTPQVRPHSQHVTPQSRTPKTPKARRDPASASKAEKGTKLEEGQYFGKQNHSIPKPLALAVMSFLTNEELYNASVVSKTWCSLALDDGLWEW